jgi:hypothetical protein
LQGFSEKTFSKRAFLAVQKTYPSLGSPLKGFVDIHKANGFRGKSKFKSPPRSSMGDHQPLSQELLQNLGEMCLGDLKKPRHFLYGNPLFPKSQESHAMKSKRCGFGNPKKMMHRTPSSI